MSHIQIVLDEVNIFGEVRVVSRRQGIVSVASQGDRFKGMSCVPRLLRNCISCIESYGCTKCLTFGRFLQFYCKDKVVPLQAWSGPKGSRRLRFPDFMTTAQDGGKVVSLTHRQPLPPRKYSWHSFLLEAESTPRP